MIKNIIVGPAFPLRGGIANFNETLCQTFVKQGLNSKIISFSLQYPNFLFPGKTQYEFNDPQYDIEIIPKINSINPVTWLRIAFYIRKENPDYIILRYWLPFMAPCLGTIAKIVKWSSGIKVIALIDNILPHERRIGDKPLTHYFVKQCDGFVIMSGSVQAELSKFTSNHHVKLIPHPIYDRFGDKISKAQARTELNLDPTTKYLLFFGLIRKYKGLDLLLNALADKRLREQNVKLIVAGEFYDNKKRYIKLINELGLAENVLLRDEYIPSELVKNYFCAADMIAQTYKSSSQSGVTQIAYHFDRPMLVTNVGGLDEMISHNKVGYVTEVNATAVADSIYDFYVNNREETFARNVGLEKSRFSWAAMVDGIQELAGELRGRLSEPEIEDLPLNTKEVNAITIEG